MVDTSKLDVEVVKAELMKFLYMEDLQEAFGQIAQLDYLCSDAKGIYPRWVVFNAVDFFRVKAVLVANGLDCETQRRLINEGVVGYLFGATVVVEDIPRGEIYISGVDEREDIFSTFSPTTVSVLRKVLFR